MARGPKPAHPIFLTPEQYGELRHIARLRESASHTRVVRAKIVVLAYEHPDWDNGAISRKVGCTDRTVRMWRHRWNEVASLQEAPRPGGPRLFSLSPAGPDHRVGLHAAG